MRIAVIVINFPRISETFVLNQITGLIDRNHEVDIFAYRRGEYTKFHPDVEKYNLISRTFYIDMPNNKIWRFIKGLWLFFLNFCKGPRYILRTFNFLKYGKKSLSLQLFYAAIPFLKKGHHDVYICHYGSCGKLGITLKRTGIIKGKIITFFHGFDMSTYIKEHGERVYDKLFKDGDLFLTISKYWKDKLIRMGYEENKIKVHRMGINTNKFIFYERKKKKQIKIITVGRLTEKKGIEYGIRAFAEVSSKYPHIRYDIVGDGPLYKELQDLIKKLNLEDKVTLFGWKNQDEIIKLMSKCDIFLLPSVTAKNGDMEGIPVVLMEAMAMRLPVIATKYSGIPELVIDGKCGFLVEERNVEVLEDKLNHLIDNPYLWAKFGKEGRHFVEENYNIDKLNDQLEKILGSLLD